MSKSDSGLPQVDVSGSPDFGEVSDRHSSSDANQRLADLTSLPNAAGEL